MRPLSNPCSHRLHTAGVFELDFSDPARFHVLIYLAVDLAYPTGYTRTEHLLAHNECKERFQHRVPHFACIVASGHDSGRKQIFYRVLLDFVFLLSCSKMIKGEMQRMGELRQLHWGTAMHEKTECYLLPISSGCIASNENAELLLT